MRTLALAALLIPIAACRAPEKTNPSPSANQVQRLETQLAKQECVGDLSQWERRYQFWTDVKQGSPTKGKTYDNIIMFRLRRGNGAYAIQPGRFLLSAEPSLSYEIDDRPGYAAGGRFDTTSGEMTLDYCGFSEGG
jgi:hypothetical protein